MCVVVSKKKNLSSHSVICAYNNNLLYIPINSNKLIYINICLYAQVYKSSSTSFIIIVHIRCCYYYHHQSILQFLVSVCERVWIATFIHFCPFWWYPSSKKIYLPTHTYDKNKLFGFLHTAKHCTWLLCLLVIDVLLSPLLLYHTIRQKIRVNDRITLLSLSSSCHNERKMNSNENKAL